MKKIDIEPIRIIGKDYSIQWTKDEHEYGKMVQHNCEIFLSSAQSIQQLRDTLLHEVLHAVEGEMDLKLPETAIRRLATGALQVLRDNPHIVKLLLGK